MRKRRNQANLWFIIYLYLETLRAESLVLIVWLTEFVEVRQKEQKSKNMHGMMVSLRLNTILQPQTVL